MNERGEDRLDGRASGELHVVFGAGPLGQATARALLVRGHRVRAVSRRGRGTFAPAVEVVPGDAADPASTRPLCATATAVYNCTNAPYTDWPRGFPPLQAGVLEGAAAAGAKLVVAENTYMYGAVDGPLTEDLPYAARTRKGRVRAAMAEALLAAHRRGTVRVAIGRGSDFYGPGVHGSAVGDQVFGPLLAGKPVTLIGDPDAPHTVTYIEDFGRALALLGEHDAALGEAWHVPGAPAVGLRRFVELAGAAAGQPARVKTMPGWLVRLAGRFNPTLAEVAEMLYEFERPYVVDAGKFRSAFGPQAVPATPLAEGIRQTVAWHRAAGHGTAAPAISAVPAGGTPGEAAGGAC